MIGLTGLPSESVTKSAVGCTLTSRKARARPAETLGPSFGGFLELLQVHSLVLMDVNREVKVELTAAIEIEQKTFHAKIAEGLSDHLRGSILTRMKPVLKIPLQEDVTVLFEVNVQGVTPVTIALQKLKVLRGVFQDTFVAQSLAVLKFGKKPLPTVAVRLNR